MNRIGPTARKEQMLAVSAWIAFKEGGRDQALRFMRTAADNEDNSLKHVAMENRLYPLRELYGDLLLEMGQAPPPSSNTRRRSRQPPTAIAATWVSPAPPTPAGNLAKAMEYYGKLVDLTKNADVERPEVRDAKAFLAQRR